MANSKVKFTLASVTEIANAISASEGLGAKAKDIANERTEAIMTAYQHIIADLAVAGIKLTKRGQSDGLPKVVMSELKTQLAEAGVTDSNVDRYSKNVNGLLKAMPQLLECTDSASVAMTLHNEGITNQAKIMAKIRPVTDPVEKLAVKVAALDEEEYNRLLTAVRKLHEAKAKEKAKLAEAAQESDEISEMLDTLEG